MAQLALATTVLARLRHGRRRRPPLRPCAPPPPGTVSVVVPARNEAARLAPCLTGLRADPDVHELLVVDDRSTDATAQIAALGGARVIPGSDLPPRWVGKAWALEQGLRAAQGEWVVFLDADTRPRPGLLRALVQVLTDDADLVSAGPRFVCTGAGERLLHASMLATIAYRAGAIDAAAHQPAPSRAMANGQCMAARRGALVRAGGWERVAGHLTEDVALARALRADGWRLAFVDATELLDVRMYESLRETWLGWGRSLMGPDVNPPARLVEDLAVLWLVMALPLPRLLLRRGTPLDAALVALRVALLAAMASGYQPRGLPFWLSPLADPATMVRLTWSVLRPTRTWRGRRYTWARQSPWLGPRLTGSRFHVSPASAECQTAPSARAAYSSPGAGAASP